MYNNVAVLLPCYNEEKAIAKVVQDFKTHLPGATIYVFDNNSADKTTEVATQAGATVIPSRRQGKGNVVRHMFEVVDAEYYIMADGDDTYPADQAPMLLEELKKSGVDTLIGTRLEKATEGAFRRFHRFGNFLISNTINELFSSNFTDVLSGYRFFTREFAKSVPLKSAGFEIETELTLQTVSKGFSFKEIAVPYSARPDGSESKLSTFTDGLLIFRAIAVILKDYKPKVFFSIVGLILTLLSLLVGLLPIREFLETGRVLRIPSTILASGLGVLAVISFAVGVILEAAYKYHYENFQLWRRLFKKL